MADTLTNKGFLILKSEIEKELRRKASETKEIDRDNREIMLMSILKINLKYLDDSLALSGLQVSILMELAQSIAMEVKNGRFN